jgi:hypothetical protein
VAGLTFPIEDLAAILPFPIVTPEAVTEGSFSKIRSFGIDWIPWFAVSGHVATRQNDGIPLDWFIMHHARMTGGTAFIVSTSFEGLHMLTMVHDQSHFFNW